MDDDTAQPPAKPASRRGRLIGFISIAITFVTLIGVPLVSGLVESVSERAAIDASGATTIATPTGDLQTVRPTASDKRPTRTEYYPIFEYTVDGVTYTTRGQKFTNKAVALRYVTEGAKADTVVAHYDAEHPERVYLTGQST